MYRPSWPPHYPFSIVNPYNRFLVIGGNYVANDGQESGTGGVLEMIGWENFFIAEVGASAALLGLIFVGVSINLTRIISIPGLPNRALLALIILLTILVVCS